LIPQKLKACEHLLVESSGRNNCVAQAFPHNH
jgi:hypothetical protein